MVEIDDRKVIAAALEVYGGFSKDRAVRISGYFDDLEEFLNVTEDQLFNIRTPSNRKILDKNDIDNIINTVRAEIFNKGYTTLEIYIYIISSKYVNNWIKIVNGLKLEDLNINPLLVTSLNLNTPNELIRFSVYASAIRSIVTSMGYLVENFLLATSKDVEEPEKTWDIIKTDQNGKKHYIQVKSGPNDMNYDQIRTWAEEIENVEKEGNKGYIGITYGKRDNKTVTFSLLEQYLKDWENKTLIGRELWEFLSGDKIFIDRVISTLRKVALDILKTDSMITVIESSIERITRDFIEKFGDGADGVKKFIDSII